MDEEGYGMLFFSADGDSSPSQARDVPREYAERYLHVSGDITSEVARMREEALPSESARAGMGITT